jgi:hypothetical protein
LAREPEYVGAKKRIRCYEQADGTCPAGEYLDSLDESGRSKLQHLFEVMGEKGKIFNAEHFKKLDGTNLFEFKRHQVRIFCFFFGADVILLSGVTKKKNRHRSADLDRAERLRESFLEEMDR